MSKSALVSSLLLSLWIGTAASAQETATTPPAPEPLWKGSAGLSYLATTGNSDTETLGLDFQLDRRPTPWGLALRASFTRAEKDGEISAERLYANARALRSLSERWELFGGISGEQDELSSIELRTLIETGAIYRALLGPVHLLAFDGGLTWTDEDRVSPLVDESFLGALLGLAYEWKFSENAALKQRLTYFPNFDTSSDWRLESITSLATSLTQGLAIQLSYELRYRNEPLGANDDTDTTTKVSLVKTF